MVGRRKMQNKEEIEINWWNLETGEMKQEFKKKVRQESDTAKWEVAKKLRLIAEEVLGKTSGKTKKKLLW